MWRDNSSVLIKEQRRGQGIINWARTCSMTDVGCGEEDPARQRTKTPLHAGDLEEDPETALIAAASRAAREGLVLLEGDEVGGSDGAARSSPLELLNESSYPTFCSNCRLSDGVRKSL